MQHRPCPPNAFSNVWRTMAYASPVPEHQCSLSASSSVWRTRAYASSPGPICTQLRGAYRRAEQPDFAFHRMLAPRYVGVELPEFTGTPEEEKGAMKVLKDHQAKMFRKYRAVANRGRKNVAVSENSCVWVKCETPVPATCRKLNLIRRSGSLDPKQ